MRLMITASMLATVLAGDLAGLAANSVAAQAPVPSSKLYIAEQFYQTRSYAMGGVESDAFSHDGKALLVSSDETGTFNAYWLPVAGGPVVPLTRSTTNATYGVSAFPRDGRVIVSSDTGGNELTHLYVRGSDGALTDITPGEKLKADFIGWQRDGSTFFVSTNERDAAAFDVYAHDAGTLQRRLVFRNEGGFQPGPVSADGKTLALVKNLSSANGDLYVVPLTAGGTPQLITSHKGDVSYDASAFTPSADKLIYLSDADGEWARAYTYDLASGRCHSQIGVNYRLKA